MKRLIDTSVWVAALIKAHPKHLQASGTVQTSLIKHDQLFVSAHSLAELYHVLTRLPMSPKITPETAIVLIDKNVLRLIKPVALSASDYIRVLRNISRRHIGGGAVFDAVIAMAAIKCGAEELVTLNVADFIRVWPEEPKRIVEP